MRQLLDDDPFRQLPVNDFWYTRGLWPCSWISAPATLLPPYVSAYRCRFTLDTCSRRCLASGPRPLAFAA